MKSLLILNCIDPQLTDYEICNKQLASIIDIGNSMKHQLHQLIEWFKSLGIFNELCLDDQASCNNSLSSPYVKLAKDIYHVVNFQ